MSKIGIFYGSSTGSTSEVAQRLAKALGAEANVYDVAGADAAEAAAFDVLLLGSSTWGIGDLQDDWEDFLPKLAEQNLAGKKVALFGCGDFDATNDFTKEGIADVRDNDQDGTRLITTCVARGAMCRIADGSHRLLDFLAGSRRNLFRIHQRTRYGGG